MSELHRQINDVAQELWGLDIYDSDMSNYHKADAQNFVLGNEFEIIIVGEVIEHLWNIQGLFESCSLHLKAGGKLIITTPNAYSMINLRHAVCGHLVPNDPYHVLNFDATTLINLLENYMSKKFSGHVFYYFESNSTLFLYTLNNFISKFNKKYSPGIILELKKNL
jgi:2-polyprenyl-3-methyl-5-hydroxy-6-metoxy-1,4-benzoquinol methylase